MAKLAKLLQAAAGAGGGAALNVEDVFSTYLYTGNGSSQTITNGIDLDGEGGAVWLKCRDVARDHTLQDTERGANKTLIPNSTYLEETKTDRISSFNSNGFTVSNASVVNGNGNDYASWTFRKAPKFFDVVTYTGNGTNGRSIAHNLDSEVGCIIVKDTSSTRNWAVYHRGIDVSDSGHYALYLNTDNSKINSDTFWNDTAPTSTHFTTGGGSFTNGSGKTYVAYLFAHNDSDGEFGPDGDADIIKCGSYTGNGTTNGPNIDLGFEPQWVIIKNIDAAGDWNMFDNMRGLSDGGNDMVLYADLSNAEDNGNDYLKWTSQGFQLISTSPVLNDNNKKYVYIAIRRGPMAVPESASDVFSAYAYTADNTDRRVIDNGILTDFVMARVRNSTSSIGFVVGSRLQGDGYDSTFLGTASSSAEAGDGDTFMEPVSGYGNAFSTMEGFCVGNDITRKLNYSSNTQISYAWKRAPSYFDIVTYVGNATNPTNINHNLNAVPEMMWAKRRDSGSSWVVYHKDLNGGVTPEQYNLDFSNGAEYDQKNGWHDTAPTSTQFTPGSYNNLNNNTYVVYLFASLSGVSKVGSYTGNGTNQNIDCGFSSGASFVLIKRTDATGDWCVYDTERGLVAGNDARLELNGTGDEQSNADSVDPYSSGFNVVQETNLNLNVNNATYIFYAIA
jgi:hypothetical protein